MDDKEKIQSFGDMVDGDNTASLLSIYRSMAWPTVREGPLFFSSIRPDRKATAFAWATVGLSSTTLTRFPSTVT